MFYYYESTVFSYLISRFLESGLGYPVENTGRLVGVTSLISASALFVYLRYAKLLPRKKWIIVPGFAVAAFAAAWMTRMAPGVGRGGADRADAAARLAVAVHRAAGRQSDV